MVAVFNKEQFFKKALLFRKALVFNKEVFGSYIIALKLREKVENLRETDEAGAVANPASPYDPLHLLSPGPQRRTLKLKETVEAERVLLNPSSPYNPLPLLPPRPQQHTLNIDIKDQEIEQKVNTPPPPDSDWIISIREKLEQPCQDDVASTWSKVCIYKVPRYLGEDDDRSYVPQIVSIGPYHHEKEWLRNMETHKWRSLRQILKRTDHDVMIYLSALMEIEERIRACYEGPISFGKDEFVQMMLLDGCFILELFRGAEASEGFKDLGYPGNDPIFAMRGSMHMIQRDLIMLENQLPLFVLDLLYGIQLEQPDQKGLVSKLALRFFDPLTLNPTDEPWTKSSSRRPEPSLGHETACDSLSDQGSLHCLDVFRRGLLSQGPRPEARHPNQVADKWKQLQLIHCVTELREAGIKFKRRKKTDLFWDVKFKNGILKIPTLFIHDGTKSLFLNLIAFEQCHLDCSSDITSYVIFMDNLIDSPEDVAYLHYCGIIEHWLGSDAEVADLFNRLCREVVFDSSKSYLSTLSDEVNRYFSYRWHSWRASLKHNYFNNPWAIISVIAAAILLLLTLAQTFYSVYGYYRPR